ncbi:hypothetical protein H632_c746p1 [Helicosporidium sp. ATCC 50920]|nr:hypothetical protein H632_c746p1 [Helicosporidium sp. ATCC 50920]|eukprot:KDD75321.1 hypothetical protein H632_c746p1 [Helicosporidium sp. ATCC 50920]
MCAKSYPGNKALRAPREVGAAFQPLSLEMQRRLEADRDANGRVPRLFVAVWGGKGAAGERLHASRSAPMRGWMDAAAMQQIATTLFEKWAREQAPGWCIEVLDMGATKFEAVDRATSDITALFRQYKKQDEDGAGSEEQEDEPDGADEGGDVGCATAASSKRGSASSSASASAERASHPSLDGAPPGTDLEAWAALPPAVRREIKEQTKMEAMLRGTNRAAQLPVGKSAAATKRPSGSKKEAPRTMQSFFERHKKQRVEEDQRAR